MISLENIHTSNIIQTGLVIFKNTYYYTNTHVYAITICEKGGHECEEEVVGCFKGREGMEKCSNYISTIILKK